MSSVAYKTAKAQLVSIIENETTISDKRFFPERFVYVKNGRTGQRFPSRSFWLEANVDGEGGIRGPYTPSPTLSGQPRSTVTMTLTVFYEDQPTRAGEMDEVLEADRIAISAALLDPGLWGRPTSGIHSLTDGPTYMRTRRVAVPQVGGVEMRTVFPMFFG